MGKARESVGSDAESIEGIRFDIRFREMLLDIWSPVRPNFVGLGRTAVIGSGGGDGLQLAERGDDRVQLQKLRQS